MSDIPHLTDTEAQNIVSNEVTMMMRHIRQMEEAGVGDKEGSVAVSNVLARIIDLTMQVSRPYRQMIVVNYADRIKAAALEAGRDYLANDEGFTHAVSTQVVDTQTGKRVYMTVAIGGETDIGDHDWAQDEDTVAWLDATLSALHAEDGYEYNMNSEAYTFAQGEGPKVSMMGEGTPNGPNYTDDEIAKFREELDDLFPTTGDNK